ncbi:Cytochrome P450 4V2 [Tyrophagus putrescentiae]|nr:Cytochrome P450 4V2 [Tyrophagus putrescentiae]
MSLLFLLLFLPLLTILFYYYKKYLRFRASVDVISGPPVSSLLLGNLSLFRPPTSSQFPRRPQSSSSQSPVSPSKAAYIREFYRTFGRLYHHYRSEGVFRLWMGPRQVVYVLTDVQSIECLLTSPANVNKGSEYRFMAPWLGEGVFLLDDDAWRRRRRLLTPAFHHRTLADFLPIFGRHSRRLVEALEAALEVSKSPLIPDIRHLFEDCMLDIVKETSLGVDETTSAESSTISAQYRESLKAAIIGSINRVLRPLHWFNWLFRWTAAGKRLFAYQRFLDEYAGKVIARRLEYFRSNSFSNFKPTKLIDILLQKYLLFQVKTFNNNSTESLTLKTIRHEISTFIFGGHDTTAEVAIYAVLLIGHHPAVQARIAEELKSVLGGNNENEDEEQFFSLETLKRLRYLEAAIREVMRLHPPGQIVGRRITEKLQLPNGKKLLAGSNCYIPLLYVHRDDRYYEQPDDFKPERWWTASKEEQGEVDVEKGVSHTSPPPFAFLTFSAGLRSCIGQRYAFLELKYVLAEVLRRFEITSVTKVEDIVIGIGPVVTPLTEIGVRLSRRRW